MARKIITKKVNVTTVHGFIMGADSTPEPISVRLAGTFADDEKATRAVRKAQPSFMFKSRETATDVYTMPVDQFIAAASKVEPTN